MRQQKHACTPQNAGNVEKPIVWANMLSTYTSGEDARYALTSTHRWEASPVPYSRAWSKLLPPQSHSSVASLHIITHTRSSFGIQDARMARCPMTCGRVISSEKNVLPRHACMCRDWKIVVGVEFCWVSAYEWSDNMCVGALRTNHGNTVEKSTRQQCNHWHTHNARTIDSNDPRLRDNGYSIPVILVCLFRVRIRLA